MLFLQMLFFTLKQRGIWGHWTTPRLALEIYFNTLAHPLRFDIV